MLDDQKMNTDTIHMKLGILEKNANETSVINNTMVNNILPESARREPSLKSNR